jgi:hypothetical protein
VIDIFFDLVLMSNPSNHLALAGGGASPNHHNAGRDLGSNTGTLSAAAAVQSADDYDCSSLLSLTSGSRLFKLDTDSYPRLKSFFFEHKDAVGRFNLSDASKSEETKERIKHGIDRLDEQFLNIDNIFVTGGDRKLRVAMQKEGFIVGKYVCHGFDGLAYDFQRYSVYEVWRCASPLINFIYVTHHHNQLYSILQRLDGDGGAPVPGEYIVLYCRRETTKKSDRFFIKCMPLSLCAFIPPLGRGAELELIASVRSSEYWHCAHSCRCNAFAQAFEVFSGFVRVLRTRPLPRQNNCCEIS